MYPPSKKDKWKLLWVNMLAFTTISIFTIQFTALDHIPINTRGGSVDPMLLKLETQWIYNLNATEYPGLN